MLLLADNGVADLTPLAALDRMGVLDFDRNVVADLAPLAGMPALWRLHAAGNRITDLGALAGLKRLAEVISPRMRSPTSSRCASASRAPRAGNRRRPSR